MTLFRWSGFALAAAVLVGCSSDGVVGPDGRFEHAAAMFSCGPAGGPAFAIYLAPDPITSVEPTGTYVRVYVAGSIDEIRGTRVPISSQSNAAAWFHQGPGNGENATAGYLMVGSGNAGGTIDGLVDLLFPTAGHVHGTFHAEWIPTTFVGCI